MAGKNSGEQFSEKETQERFEAALRGGLNTPHKPVAGRNKRSALHRVSDGPHSSFHRDVRAGLFPEDWAGDASATGSFGERV
jgi:hypothetical protein